MIIVVTKQNSVEIREPNDFKGFKIVVERPVASTPDIAAALRGIAKVDADGKTAWVFQDALHRLTGAPQTTEWAASVDKMIESVKRFGWVNETDRTVRAHIEAAG